MANEESQTLHVTGMTCGNCVNHVEKALRGTAGVTEAKVDLKRELATVRSRPGVQRTALVAAIQEAGYGVKDGPATQADAGWKFWKR